MRFSEFNNLVVAANGQVDSYVSRLETVFAEAFERSQRYATERFKAQTLTASAWTPPIPDTLASGLTEDEQDEADGILHALAEQITSIYGTLAIPALGVSVYEALRQRAIQNYNDQLYDTLKAVVTRAFDQGLSAEETAEIISTSFVEVGPTTASMMAETMIATVVNERSLTAANAAFKDREKPVFKVWETRRDARVRPAHASTQSQARPLDQPFSVGGSSLMFPGDPSGPMNLVARCRCWMSYTESLTAAAPPSLTPTMGMVAVYPSLEEAMAIADMEPEGLHCTLVFLGEVTDTESITRAIGEVAAVHAPLSGTIGGMGIFSDTGDGYPLIALPDVKGLTGLREAAVAALASVGIESPSEHGFLPHMTLEYLEEPSAIDMAPIGLTVSFDTISVVIGDTVRVDYTLDGGAVAREEEEMAILETDTAQQTTGMTAAVTITIDDGPAAADAETSEAAVETGWTARLAIEGQQTEDLRLIEKGALTWRDLPLTLMAMDETSAFGGHDGAKVAGKITEISRDDGELTNDINGSGLFDSGEYGQEIARMVGEQTLRGNSVDLAVNRYEYRNADTGGVLEGDALWDAFFDDVPILFVVLDGVILASTVCPTPAIGGAEIMLASGRKQTFFGPPKEGEFVMNFHHDDWAEIPDFVLTAGAAGMAPLHPPLAWFDNPALDGPTPLTVTKEGRVFGHAALFDSCHIAEPSGAGVCVPPPRSGMGYSVFHHGAVETAEGIDVPCGQITLGTTHASSNLTWQQTIEHYENSGMAVADVAAGEDEWGIYLAGGLRPDVPAERVREMKAGSISGDWRTVINRGLEFVGALIVNIPGFPIPRPEARVVASAAGDEEIMAITAAGMVEPAEEIEGTSRRAYLRRIEALTH